MKKIGAVAVAILALSVTLVALRTLTRVSDVSQTTGNRHRTAPRHRVTLPVQPECAPGTGGTQLTIETDASVSEFTQTCYYAAADRQLSLTFTNTLVTLIDKESLTLTLEIFDSESDALTQGPEGTLSTETDKAVFVAPELASPGSETVALPALKAGTYFVMTMELPEFTYATLVVS